MQTFVCVDDYFVRPTLSRIWNVRAAKAPFQTGLPTGKSHSKYLMPCPESHDQTIAVDIVHTGFEVNLASRRDEWRRWNVRLDSKNTTRKISFATPSHRMRGLQRFDVVCTSCTTRITGESLIPKINVQPGVAPHPGPKHQALQR